MMVVILHPYTEVDHSFGLEGKHASQSVKGVLWDYLMDIYADMRNNIM